MIFTIWCSQFIRQPKYNVGQWYRFSKVDSFEFLSMKYLAFVKWTKNNTITNGKQFFFFIPFWKQYYVRFFTYPKWKCIIQKTRKCPLFHQFHDFNYYNAKFRSFLGMKYELDHFCVSFRLEHSNILCDE